MSHLMVHKRVSSSCPNTQESDECGGMYNTGGLAGVTNSILWRNTDSQIGGPATVSCSGIEGGWPGEGNIDDDPLFVYPDVDPMCLACCLDLVRIQSPSHPPQAPKARTVPEMRLRPASVEGAVPGVWDATPQVLIPANSC